MGNSCKSATDILKPGQISDGKGQQQESHGSKSQSQYDGGIDPICFKHMDNLQQKYFLTEQQIEVLKFNRQKYKKVRSIKEKEKQKNAIYILAKANSRLENEAHQTHIRALGVAEILFSKNFNLNMLKADGLDDREIETVAKQCKKACHEDLSAFGFLSSYIQLCIRNLSKSGKTVEELEERLLEILKAIRKNHPPNENSLSEAQISKARTADTLQKEYCGKGETQKMIVDLSAKKDIERNKYLDDFIAEIAKKSDNNMENLIDITKESCQENEGKHYKTGVKVSTPPNQSALDRVKEKLLSKDFKKFEIDRHEKDLNKFLKEEKDAYHQQLDEIYKSTDKPVEFTVSDMLRGKCMFDQISQIIEAAKSIAKECKQKSFQIVEIDNRLSGKTMDLVFKVLVEGVITQFQLAYIFNVVNNEFNHKIYELVRSKFFTVLSTLSEFNERANGKLCQINEMVVASAKMQQDIRGLNIKGGSYLKRSDLKQQMKKWFKKCNINQKAANQKHEVIHFNRKGQQKEIDWYLSARYFYYINDYQKSQQFADKWFETIEKDDEKSLLEYEEFKGSICRNWGKVDESLKHELRGLEIQEKIRGIQSVEYSSTLNDIGNLYKKKKDYVKALQYFEKSGQIRQKIKGRSSPQYADVMINIAGVYLIQKNFDKALEKYQQSLEIKQKVKGSDSEECALIINNIAMAYQDKKQYEKSIEYFSKALQIYQKVSGKDSFGCGRVFKNLGKVYRDRGKQGDQSKALDLYQDCLSIYQKVKGQGSTVGVLNNIGNIYKDRKDFEKAIQFYQKSLEIKEKINGKDSADTIISHSNIGYCYYKQGDYEKALQFNQRGLDLVMKLPDPQGYLLYESLKKYVQKCKDKKSKE